MLSPPRQMPQPTKLFDGKVVDVDPASLKPAPYNPRINMKTANPPAFERVKKSLAKGIFKPILVNKRTGYIVGGHQRVEAAIDLGWQTVPVLYLDVSKADEKRINIADNADWEGQFVMPMLHDMVLELQSEGVDPGLLGFSDLFLDDLALDGETGGGAQAKDDEFDAEAEAEKIRDPITKPGDLYILGKHRLLCGDATKKEDVAYLMDGKKADMVFTDPPYGVAYQSNMRTKSRKFDVLKNDATFLADWVAPVARVSAGFVFVWTTWRVIREWMDICAPFGELTNVVIWDKGGGGMGDLEHTFSTDYEIALVYNRGAHLAGKRLGSVWSLNKDGSATYLHPTQKPVALASTAIESVTRAGARVLDVFGGSGTTLIACENAHRSCCMMELDPKYCDVIVKRWEQLTGKTAQRIAALREAA